MSLGLVKLIFCGKVDNLETVDLAYRPQGVNMHVEIDFGNLFLLANAYELLHDRQ